MLPRHRRRLYLNEPEFSGGRRTLTRVIIGVVLFIVLWYLIAGILALFDGSIGKRASVTLSTASDNIDVALQGEDWQRADASVRLYAGDAVATRGASDAVVTFFDGTGMRLDQATELSIEESDRRPDDESTIEVELTRGRLWVATPTTVAYSGSITRTIVTEYASVNVPSDASALISSELIHVVRSDGQGLTVTLKLDGAKGKTVIVGEGQYVSLTAEDRAALAEGIDPYTLRDPATTELIRDPFLASSFALLSKAAQVIAETPTDEAPEAGEDLTLSSPQNDATVSTKTLTVSGQVSDRVATVIVQGQDITIGADGSFSAELSLGQEATAVIRVEAQDSQGIPLQTIERTVKNTWKAFVEPVRITAPVGSGETLVTGLSEIEITGEAPSGAAQIIVNDYALQLFKPGARTWSYLASVALGNLKVGDNVFTVYAADEDGNRSTGRSITITVEEGAAVSSASAAAPIKQNPPILPGSLTVTGPASGTEATITEKETVLEGVTSAETATVSINGYTLSLYTAGKTTWNYIASTEFQTLKRGRNVYRIVARNASGEILDLLEYVIIFNP